MSRAASESWLVAVELRLPAAAVPQLRFGAAALRRRGLLADPALERPRMAFPEAQGTHRSWSTWHIGSGGKCPLWVISGH